MSKIRIIFLVLTLFTGLCAYSDDINTHSDIFFECLKTCTDYRWEIIEKSDNGKLYNRLEQKAIKKSEDGKCSVSIRAFSYDQRISADANDIEAAEFPFSVLKKINKQNFKKYFSKYSVVK